ncbi:MAG: phosphatase PAP2 family protein [Clostridiales bacterium]|nr:phosphatase PAP2 family protein [Clostridiales bacterium]
MQKPFYDRLAYPFEVNERKKRRLIRANDIISKAFYIAYPVLLAVLALMRDARVIRVLLVPLFSFLAVTVFRKALNAPRPYEVWDSPPLIPKDTKGNSFPSRHVFCVFIIAMAAAYVCKPAAIVMMAAGVFLAVVRVIARVHFIKDVVAGALIAIILGRVGFWII